MSVPPGESSETCTRRCARFLVVHKNYAGVGRVSAIAPAYKLGVASTSGCGARRGRPHGPVLHAKPRDADSAARER